MGCFRKEGTELAHYSLQAMLEIKGSAEMKEGLEKGGSDSTHARNGDETSDNESDVCT
jgi:hypothetical protein